MESAMDLRTYIKDVPDFPKPGIMFRDISPLLASPEAMFSVTTEFMREWSGEVDAIAALDARGFIFGTALATILELPLVMVRKHGKLPGKTVCASYDLEYGSNTIEIPADAFKKGARVLIVDDVLATGGTASAAGQLVAKVGAEIAGYAFVIELSALNGRACLNGAHVQSLLVY
jgi:adenine phosphoribosyltransferase